MHDGNRPLATGCGQTRKSSANGLAECTHALRPMVAGGTQHGSRLANSAQPSAGEVDEADRVPADMEGVRATATAATRANHAGKSEWHLWATRRVSGGTRYIPKARRTW